MTTVTGLFVVFMIMMAMVQAEEGRCTVVCRQQYIRVSVLGQVVLRPAIKVLNCFYYLTIDKNSMVPNVVFVDNSVDRFGT